MAFGVGSVLAIGWKNVTANNFARTIASAMASKTALNRFKNLQNSHESLTQGMLTFIPEFGGFDTRSCKKCPEKLAKKFFSISSIRFGLSIQKHWMKENRNYWDPDKFLEWTKERFENYYE